MTTKDPEFRFRCPKDLRSQFDDTLKKHGYKRAFVCQMMLREFIRESSKLEAKLKARRAYIRSGT